MEKVDPSKNEYYLYVGRVSKEKGVDLFCQAISELDYKGIVVGDVMKAKNIKQNLQINRLHVGKIKMR